jgi:glutathione S-transferase
LRTARPFPCLYEVVIAARPAYFGHGDQFPDAYRAVNPQMVVPTLIDGDIKLFQSLAILEYLDEAYPEPALLPAGLLVRLRPYQRA